MKIEDLKIGDMVIASDFSHIESSNGRPGWNHKMYDHVDDIGKVVSINSIRSWVLVEFKNGYEWWYFIEDINYPFPSDSYFKIPHSLKDEVVTSKNFVRKGDVYINVETNLVICTK